MEKHSCKTYFAVWLDFDKEKNIRLLHERRECAPEEIGILNKEEVERAIVEITGEKPEWKRHHFVIGVNENYNVDVNEMLRVTLKNLFGKEEKLRELQTRFGVETSLVIVPKIISGSEEPNQCLSFDMDIVEFLYKSNTSPDLDYYVV